MREIERIIRVRHGIVPDTDDADLYLDPVANCFRLIATGRNFSTSVDDVVKLFSFWTETNAPNVNRGAAVKIVRRELAGPPELIGDDVIGRSLRLSYAERLKLKITTIGSFDADRAMRAELAKNRRRERDRLRKANERRAQGSTSHADSLSRTKPWENEGITRRTWERRRKKAEVVANSSPHHADQVVANSSPYPLVIGGDVFATLSRPSAGRHKRPQRLADVKARSLSTGVTQ